MNAIRRVALTTLVFGLSASALLAEGAEKVVNQDGKIQAQVAGKLQPMNAAVAFPNGVVVNTNGAFKVGQGAERKLENGQAITADGMLHKPDGSVGPVFDHYVVKGGRVYVVKDGAAPAPLNQTVVFSDGSSLSPDAFHRGSGRITRLIDGQTLRVDGNVVPALDTVTLKNGKVTVQKDGALIPVTTSIMMNDGSKVFANGTVLSFDGKTTKLAEGQTITLPGAVMRR